MRMAARFAVFVASVLPGGLFAQQGLDTVQIRTQTLAPGVHVLFGAGGNIGLSVGEDAVFVIDDQFAPLTPKILAAIAALTPKPVKFVVNTHWHFDHTGGNENLGKAGALIVAHDNVRTRMSSEQFIQAFNRREPPAPKDALPVVTFAEGVTFHLNGDRIAVSHLPAAHTDGDALIYFSKANVLHMGDVFNMSGLPFVDRSSGGSIHGVIAAAERAIGMSNASTQIIPGHGRVVRRGELQAWRDMLVALRDRMRAEIAAGRSVDEVLAAKITEPYAKDWPGGHERFVRTLHQELSSR
ncbi:MAG: MBL fold metallo-hydrolase [Gemmatimonadetes bacterium]|nr:MBL fold metallo-hydrolase [Gemmatimonadota bacterium]